MRSKIVLPVLLLAIVTIGFSEDKPSEKKVEATEAVKVKILQAIHDQDVLKQQQLQIQNHGFDLQQQLAVAGAQYNMLTGKIEDSEKIVKKRIDEGAQALNLDPNKYEFDRNSYIYIPKVSPVQPTPSPDKK